jgi:hypothetical protein
MKVTSWEALMDAIDVNGDGKISLEELERQVFTFTNIILLNLLFQFLVSLHSTIILNNYFVLHK